MDRQTLERLMIDDALGALSPDASALLAVHTDAGERGRWKEIAALAKSAGAGGLFLDSEAVAEGSLPAGASGRRVMGRILVMAAMLLVGLGIGLLIPRRSASPPMATLPGPQWQLDSAVAAAPAADAVPDFWSSRRLIGAAVNRNGPPPPHWSLEGIVR